ncbi:hypothetical protein CR62_08165 [Serratia grimesii]|jgi:filamentous hemagglutinin|uniref:Uncharacterized protein n=1 Tax=Serratia grimesii TaxID=82995 RepID=A0ABR4UDU5_9GAMM|nr:hypothetical protein CR62_08165 [Serratia grimesii]
MLQPDNPGGAVTSSCSALVIASTATADNNRLDTGTLGFSDIHNQTDFKAEHQGGSISSGGPVGADLLTNLAGAALSGAGNKGHAKGTTQAAVSGGSVIIRDLANQKIVVLQWVLLLC